MFEIKYCVWYLAFSKYLFLLLLIDNYILDNDVKINDVIV